MHTTGGDAAEAKDTPMAAAADPHSEGGAPGDQGASPQKRGRVNEQPLTIAMLREVLAQERELDRAHLVESLESVKGDVRAIQNRVDSVEQGVTAQMEKTLKMLDKITDNYSSQAKALEELKDTQDKFRKRLEALELKPQFSSAPGSTADTVGGGGKPPAFILGGWHPDQAAEDTLRAARDILRTLDVQLNAEDMFVQASAGGTPSSPSSRGPSKMTLPAEPAYSKPSPESQTQGREGGHAKALGGALSKPRKTTTRQAGREDQVHDP